MAGDVHMEYITVIVGWKYIGGKSGVRPYILGGSLTKNVHVLGEKVSKCIGAVQGGTHKKVRRRGIGRRT
jgi:hypothetical protein